MGTDNSPVVASRERDGGGDRGGGHNKGSSGVIRNHEAMRVRLWKETVKSLGEAPRCWRRR